MDLEHSFTVPLPEERAWELLLDVERVAPCMPGATLDSVDGDVIKGRIKVKVGPIAMTYAGTARFTERDPAAHFMTLEASGKETRGAGTASAKVRSMLEGQGEQTHVVVHTSLNVTGRPAQFGRGVMAEVGGKLVGIFASNLADMLGADQLAGSSPAPGSPARPPAADSVAGADSPAGPVSATDGRPAGAPGNSTSALAGPIEELNLTVRSYTGLRREGIHTVGELASRTREQLLAIENIGPASVKEIRQKLADRGIALSESPASANGVAAGAGPVMQGAAAGTAAAQAAAGSGSAGPAAEPGVAAAAAGPAPGPADEDALDLLSVAGMPVLKRALPVVGVLLAAILIALGLRRRRRR